MRNSSWIYFFLISLFCTTCRKDNEITGISISEPCVEIPPAPVGFGYNFILDTLKPHYEAPHFNPSNPNEIVLLVNDFYKNNFGLYYFNMVTKEKRQLYDKRVNFQPKWGRNGWILFCGDNKQVWKVKPNGDSLMQLTFEGENYSPEWNKDATLFLTNTFKSKYFLKIYKPLGESISEIENCGGSNMCWQHDSIILFISSAWLSSITPNNCIPNVYKNTSSDFVTGNAIWVDNSRILYAADGLRLYDISDNSDRKIKNGCNSRYYVFICYSTQSNKIIANKVERKLINSNTLYVKSYIVTMDLDGKNESELLIP